MALAVRLRQRERLPIVEREGSLVVARLVPQGMLRGVGATVDEAIMSLQQQVDRLYAELRQYEGSPE